MLNNGSNVNFARSQPKVCVTGAGVGVDSVWEQEKPETRKMLENATESRASSARFIGHSDTCYAA
jgi:hypothetical protein